MRIDRNKKEIAISGCFRDTRDISHEIVDFLLLDRPDPDSRRTYDPLYNSSYVPT